MAIGRMPAQSGRAPGVGSRFSEAAFLSLLVACLGTSTSAAAGGEGEGVKALLLSGTAHDALYDIAFEASNGMAVGAFGTILTTADGGTAWARQSPAPTPLALLGVAMRGGKCVVVGQMGAIFAAEDCRHWQRTSPVTKARLNAVSLNRSGRVCAVGAFGTILSSFDSGTTWTQLPLDWNRITGQSAEPHLYGVHVGDEGAITVVGEFELILRSTDGGAQWKVLHKGERSLFGLQLLDNGQAYAVGQSGAVLASSDAGSTWRSLDTGSKAILTGILASPGGKITVSGINTVLFSGDGGASWSSVRSKLVSDAWHEALAASQDGSGNRRVISVGAGGAILELSQQ
jgi:photosystem II stability/assembly factor-like uncharacterized protein